MRPPGAARRGRTSHAAKPRTAIRGMEVRRSADADARAACAASGGFRASAPHRHDDRNAKYCVRLPPVLYSPRRTNRRGRGYCVSRARRDISGTLAAAESKGDTIADFASRPAVRPASRPPRRPVTRRVALRVSRSSSPARYHSSLAAVYTPSDPVAHASHPGRVVASPHGRTLGVRAQDQQCSTSDRRASAARSTGSIRSTGSTGSIRSTSRSAFSTQRQVQRLQSRRVVQASRTSS